MKTQVNLKNIKAYVQGKVRYRLFYSRFYPLIPKHIREQIEYRVNSMDLICYEEGQCRICGCETTALQMANKMCDKPCYPPMLNKENWKWLLAGGMWFDKENKIIWRIDKDKLIFKRVTK